MSMATDARDEAMAQADHGANDIWKDSALSCIRAICKDLGFGTGFTTDLVWTYLERDFPGAHTHEPKALGPIMARAAKMGLIRKTGTWKESERAECHARPMQVWNVSTFSVEV